MSVVLNRYASELIVQMDRYLKSQVSSKIAGGRRGEAARVTSRLIFSWIASVEERIHNEFGRERFPAMYFADLLVGFINSERKRRVEIGLSVQAWDDALAVLYPFIRNIDALMDKME